MAAIERHTVRLEPGDIVEPGNYSLRDGATVERRPTSDVCPYCHDQLTEFVTDGARRVATLIDEQPRSGVQVVGVHQLPDGHRLLKCDACRQFFSSMQEART